VDRDRDRVAARRALGIAEERFMMAAVGGSLGSGKINDVIDAFVGRQRDRSDLAVRHIVGARNDDGLRREHNGDDGLQYQVVPFEERMDLVLAACDLLVARAGASTVAEISALGVPSILAPWPEAADDHQSANAAILGDAGGAVVTSDPAFDEAYLSEQIDRFQRDPDSLRALGANAARLGRRDGAQRIAQRALEVAGVG
jgi:UDP-N-acetylglucosamine--N-acetylmuramyl-(pentapeptide) pyrophosphoryl-undecaprenol N-acetylglucosamine transferase